MNYPAYPPPQQPQYPPPQQPGYPPQQPQYPPQQPQYPPQQPAYYPPPAQQYAPPPVQQQPAASIDEFYDQPAASGKSVAGWFQTPGQKISGIIARAITPADTRPQTDMQTKQPRYFNDGRRMLTMTIPLLVTPSPDFPDGRAAWIINSSDREDLDMAMQAAGCKPRTVPEAGALVTIEFVGLKQIPGFGVPKKVKRVTYQRPPGAASGNGNGQAPFTATDPAAAAQYGAAPAPVPAPAPGTAPAPAPQYAQQAPPPGYQGEPYQNPAPGAVQPPPFQPPQYQQGPPGQDPYAMATGQPPPQQYAQPGQYAPDPTQQTPFATAPAPGGAPAMSAAPATASNGQFAAPEGLSPEQEARLRALTGQ